MQAYLLWEQAGRPEGADFAGDARAALEAQACAGKSVEEIEAAMKAPEAQVLPASPTPRCLGDPLSDTLTPGCQDITLRDILAPHCQGRPL